MRPIKLTMSAFGPYAGEEVLDMEQLGRGGLYLITGVTGAGKSSIFDAICYALYGDLSGKSRDAKMFRSQYADPKTETFVELVFDYNGRRYRVRRNPDYMRPKTRGEGFTAQKADAELEYPDGRKVTKVKEVNQAIEEIMGIDRSQFTQIAMIAQGDFRDLLLAKTEVRMKIFQKLFNTQRFYALQERLKEESNGLANENQKLADSISQYTEGIECAPDTPLMGTVQQAKDGNMLTEEVMHLLEALNAQDEVLRTDILTRQKAIDEQLSGTDVLLGKVDAQQKAQRQKAAAEAALTGQQAELENCRAAYEVQQNLAPERELREKRSAAISAELPGYKELEEKRTALKQQQKNLVQLHGQLETEQSHAKQLKEQYQQQKTELEGLRDADAEKATMEGAHFRQGDKSRKLSDLQLAVRKLNRMQDSLRTAQNTYLDCAAEAKKCRDTYQAMHQAYLDEQAGILAEILVDGEPCPVCGSCTHPHKAVKSERAPSKAELENAERRKQDAEGAEFSASADAGAAKAAYETHRDAVLTSAVPLMGEVTLEELPDRLQTMQAETADALNALKEALQKIEDRLNRKAQLEKSQPMLERQMDTSAEACGNLERQIASGKNEQKNLEERVKTLENQLQFSGKSEAEQEIKKLNAANQQAWKNLDRAKQAVDDCLAEINTQKGKLEAAEKLLEQQEELDWETLTARQAELRGQKQTLQEAFQAVSDRLSANGKIYNNIKKQAAGVSAVEQRYRWLKVLSDTAIGKYPNKIMLETYVQMNYFDRVLEWANTRLMTMSEGQYELIRRRDPKDNRSQTGLDLDVIDHYNGSVRMVNSLSGGESFMASLALALGMSDEIQASAGGIHLDTMFVDEGFGSLSEDALQQAIKVLMGLSEGNRLVGIISHVAELKEVIDKQIIVKKDREKGSHATIVV